MGWFPAMCTARFYHMAYRFAEGMNTLNLRRASQRRILEVGVDASAAAGDSKTLKCCIHFLRRRNLFACQLQNGCRCLKCQLELVLGFNTRDEVVEVHEYDYHGTEVQGALDMPQHDYTRSE